MNKKRRIYFCFFLLAVVGFTVLSAFAAAPAWMSCARFSTICTDPLWCIGDSVEPLGLCRFKCNGAGGQTTTKQCSIMM